MTTGQRALSALLALLLGSGALYLTRERAQGEAFAHSLSAQAAALPNLAASLGDAASLSKIELELPPSDDAPAPRITLEKAGAAWRIVTPIHAAASVDKVRAMLQNLASLHVNDVIDASSAAYGRYGLGAADAVHLTVWRGADKASELFFGKSSARGQLLRIAGREGVFSLPSNGSGSYAGFLYTRPLGAWRERAILGFDPTTAVAVQIENRHGRFSFSKRDGVWRGVLAARHAPGVSVKPEPAWPRFDPARVEALLAAFKALSADEFGRDADRAEAGLEHAAESGGVLRIALDGPARELVIRVGNVAHGPSDWAIKDSRWALKEGEDGTLYALATWTTDWVTSGRSQFE